MDRPNLTTFACAQANRLKAATIGFGIAVAPVGAIAAVQFALMPQVVRAIDGLDGDEQLWAISALRRDWLAFHTGAAVLIAIYWLLTAALGRGQLLRIKSANIALALSGVAFAFFTMFGSIVQKPGMKGLCPILGLSDTDAPFGFDAQSSCEAFANAAYPLIAMGLLGLQVVLLATSVILRIAWSRRSTPS